MAKKKSVIREAIEQINAKQAIGVSRFEAKQARRETGESVWAFSTGRYHSHGTRRAYQQHTLHFLNWCRDQYHLRDLDEIKARANELVSQYLYERIVEGKSAYTLATERSALRFFFSDWQLAEDIVLPRRYREQITRSRKPAVRDRDFQPANWQKEIQFLESSGLRRAEAMGVQCSDIHRNIAGDMTIFVARGKGGKSRSVPVIPRREPYVERCIEGRDDLEEPVFPRLPSHLDIHAIRRMYAQHLYCHLSGRELPPSEGRLHPKDYDRAAAIQVSKALGHGERRVDMMMRHYLR